MIDIKNYNDLKDKNLSRLLETTDDNIVVAYKKFDMAKAAVGELVELPEEVAVQSKTELVNQIATLQSQIDEINSFLSQQ